MAAPALVSPAWLYERLGDPDLRIIDARYYVPGSGRDAEAEFAAAHIPGAIRFDLDRVRDADSSLPHMMPKPADFAVMLGALGIGADHHIVAYDTLPGIGAMRAWWMLKAIGHEQISVLDGGLPAWQALGLPVDGEEPSALPVAYDLPRRRPTVGHVTKAEVAAASQSGTRQIVDVRPTARFEGQIAEPRPGLRSGHIPGSHSLPFAGLFAPDGTLLPTDQLAAVVQAAGIDPTRPIITSCGSGVSAAALGFALVTRLNAPEVAIYEGSWTEWGADPAAPVAVGPA